MILTITKRIAKKRIGSFLYQPSKPKAKPVFLFLFLIFCCVDLFILLICGCVVAGLG
jgi:hypothetical protein